MAYNFLPSDPDQPFLLPPDLRDWLPADHLAWFVRDLVNQLDLKPFLRAYRNDGHGHPAYDPKTLLGVLLYAYAIGVRSSRQIERHCTEDLAFRVLAGNQLPDHGTIARFRVRHQTALAGFLVQSLKLCAASGLVRLGVVALDGAKVAANAATTASHTHDKIQAEVAEILRQAAEADQREDLEHGAARGDQLPEALPPRLAGWRGCARPRPSWRPRRPSGNAGMSSGSPSWRPPPGPGASNPGRTSSRGAVTRRPTPRRPPMSPTPTAASCTPGVAASRVITPRRSPPWTRWSSPPS
jgi:transposase